MSTLSYFNTLKAKKILLFGLLAVFLISFSVFLQKSIASDIVSFFSGYIQLNKQICNDRIYYKKTWFCFTSDVYNKKITLNDQPFKTHLDSLNYHSQFKIVKVVLTDQLQSSYQMRYKDLNEPSESFGFGVGPFEFPVFLLQFDGNRPVTDVNTNSHKLSRLFIHAMFQMMHRENDVHTNIELLSNQLLLITSTKEPELPIQIE